MSVLLLLVAIVFITLYALGHGLMPLLLSILYILGFSALALIEPRGPAMNGLAVLVLAIIALYGVRRLWSRIGARRNS
jgi:membrane protein implicated in regulation of membrane protease activity